MRSNIKNLRIKVKTCIFKSPKDVTENANSTALSLPVLISLWRRRGLILVGETRGGVGELCRSGGNRESKSQQFKGSLREKKKKKKRAASQVEQRMRGENAGVMLQRKQRKEKRRRES